VVFLQPAAPTTLSDQCILSSSFAFLQSLAQHDLVRRPRPTNTSHGLSLPSAHQGSEVHSRGFASPATFRPQGLVTLSAAYSLRARAGFVSHRQRSWDSPFGAFPSRKVSATSPGGRTHLPFSLPVLPPPKRWAGPTGADFWALTLPRVPGGQTGINSPTAGCSLGFCPSRANQQKPGPDSRPRSSHALRQRPPHGERQPAPRSVYQLLPGPVRPTRQAE
jgi:hypothetical protein